MTATARQNCEWIKGDSAWTCMRCKRSIEWSESKGPLIAKCKVACRFIGQAMTPIKVSCNCPDNPTNTKIVSVFQCQIHGRCLPGFNPTGEDLEKWEERKPESDIYRLCLRCDDFESSNEFNHNSLKVQSYIKNIGDPPCCDPDKFMAWLCSAAAALKIDKSAIAAEVELFYKEPR